MGSQSCKLKDVVSSNATYRCPPRTNAIVFGGTSGIGEAIAVRLARAGSNVTIVGRNAKAGEAIVASMKSLGSQEGEYRFVPADVSLIQNCRRVAAEYSAQVPHVNCLVFCQTKATFQGRTPTSEGLDEKLALNYFSRIELIRLLLPKLHAAPSRPSVMSVLSAGVHAPYERFREDFRLEHNFSLKNAADAAGLYNDLCLGRLAELHPSISFCHASPGFVSTNWGTDLPTPARWGVRVLQLAARSKEDCAEWLFPPLIGASASSGLQLVGQYGEAVAATKYQSSDHMEFVWSETQAALDAIPR